MVAVVVVDRRGGEKNKRQGGIGPFNMRGSVESAGDKRVGRSCLQHVQHSLAALRLHQLQ